MKDNPVAKHAHKFNKAQVHKDKKKEMKKGERKHKGSYESVDEVLNVSDGIAAWIKDFQSSDAPQFQGKSDAKRKEMAIAAYLDAKKGSKEESMNEKTLHIDLDDFRSARQDKVVNILKKHEKQGHIKHAGSTDKGELFDIKNAGAVTAINRELKQVGGGYRLGESMKEVKEPTGDLKNACWKGYTAVGTKKKNGKTVPNCVPKESLDEKSLKTSDYPKGTSMSAKKFKDSQKKMSNQRALSTKDYRKGTSMSATDWKNRQEEVELDEAKRRPSKAQIAKVMGPTKNIQQAYDAVMKKYKVDRETARTWVLDVYTNAMKNMKEEVSEGSDVHARYMRAHGKKAKGQGQWMFTTSRTGDTQGKEFSQRGDFSTAHKAAQKHFGTKNVYVMESTAAYGKSMADIRAKKQRAGMSSSDRNKMSKVADMMRREREKKAQRKEEAELDEGSAQDRLNQRASKLGIGNRNKAADDYMAKMKAKHGEKGVADRLASNQAKIDAIKKARQRREDVQEELSPVQKRKHMNLKKRAKAGNSQAKIRLKAFEKEFAKDIEMEKGSAKQVNKAVKGKGVGDVSTQQAFSGKGGGKGDDDNLIVQLRKAQDLNGKMDIKVTPAGKSAQLPKALIDKLLAGYDRLQKPEDKKKFKLLLTKELRKRAK